MIKAGFCFFKLTIPSIEPWCVITQRSGRNECLDIVGALNPHQGPKKVNEFHMTVRLEPPRQQKRHGPFPSPLPVHPVMLKQCRDI